MNVMKFKGYIGSIEASIEDGVLHGKLLHIRDLVTYEAVNVAGLQEAFEEAVDDYLEDCETSGQAPDKPFKGAFNVRVTPDLHRQLAETAMQRGCNLNEYVATVLSNHSQLFERLEAKVTPAHFSIIVPTPQVSNSTLMKREQGTRNVGRGSSGKSRWCHAEELN